MKQQKTGMAIVVGGSLLMFGGMTVLTGDRELAKVPATEPAPMDALMAGAESTPAWDLTPTRNDAVENWIDFLAGRNAERTRLWMERSGRYGPSIRAELRARDMPEDLLYLAFIESGFSTKAYSSAAASGIWQFIEETGERYGLEVNSEVDERRDPLKSTGAALDYLQDLHDRFGSWYLAAAAYNTGENRVGRLMREHTGSEKGEDADFWTIAPDLPRETRNYVPLMLAAGFINKNAAEHGFDDVEFQDPLQFEVAWVPGGTPLSVVADAAGVTEADVKDLNPHLMKSRTPAKRGWGVRIPSGSKVVFDGAFPKVLAQHKAEAAKIAAATRKHTIRRGETLSEIAQQYGVSLRALEAANSSVNPRRLIPGRVVSVPGGKGAQSASVYHVVRRGENLSVIADRYDLSVSKLKRVNGLAGSRIQPGQRLKVRV